jgi:hypothetical protein
MDVAPHRSAVPVLLRTIATNMEQAKSFLRVLAWMLAVMPIAVVAALARAHVRRRRDGRRQHVQRLAGEIVEVALSIAQDLETLPRTSDAVDLGRRTGDCRQRTEDAAATRTFTEDGLERTLRQLHDDHLRIVDLRSEVDAAMAARRSGKPVTRACKFANGSKPSRSRWSSTLSTGGTGNTLTRPSSFC